MTKVLNLIASFLIAAQLLFGCSTARITETLPSIQEETSMPNKVQSTFTSSPIDRTTVTLEPLFTPTSFPTPTVTILPSLEPIKAKELIESLLKEPKDCMAPCFWEIIPGQTKLVELKSTLTRMGFDIKSTTLNNQDYFYGVNYDFNSGLSFTAIFTVADEIVKNLRLKITPEPQKAGTNREWSTYSPETIIQHYGPPSKVDLFLGRGPITSLDIVLYFDPVDMIIEYYIGDIGPKNQICPPREQFNSVRVWMGKNPYQPPLAGQPLEKTTGLTLDEFAKIMTGDPEQACFTFDPDKFP